MNKNNVSYLTFLQELESDHGGPVSDRIRRTLRLAMDGHHGQWRVSKDPRHQVPFIVHPVGTARLVMKYVSVAEGIRDDPETLLCVALAHDLLEDTRIDASQIEAVAGPKVRIYVEALTKPPSCVPGRTHNERNHAFVEQIIHAGPGAVFIKICDNIHDLSRPGTKPVKLLEQLIDKARHQYAPMLERCPLGLAFQQAYADAIDVAESALVAEKQFSRDTPLPDSEEMSISECVAASAGKILELHDIAALLQRTCRTSNVTIWCSNDHGGESVTQVIGPERQVSRLRLPVSRLNDCPQAFTSEPVTGAPALLAGVRCSTVYVVPTRIDRDTTLLVVLGYEPKELPSWVSLAFATMQIHFLAHRLVVSEADRRARLGAEAARLGLQLDADIAARIGVTAADLSHLHLWRTRCQQAILGVTHLTNFCLLANSAILPFAELIKVSSRVKAVDSILHKFLPPTKRIWPEYGQLEDIAGVRVICPTLSCLKIIEDFLVGQKAAAHGVRLHSTIVPSRRDYISSPTKSGYRAIHLILEVETYLGDEGVRNVPCEVQLRTTFQDVWAVISHATLYGADRKERRRHSDKLRDTALALEHSENLLEELISSEEK